MGTGWRRALCTSVQRDDDHDAVKRRPQAPGGKLAFFGAMAGGSNPNSALRCRTKPATPQPEVDVAPSSAPATKTLSAHSSASAAPAVKRMQALSSAPSSPRSASRFALFKASILPTKARCGVCTRGVKSGGGAAVFTAECSHSFHFPCIAVHARAAAAAAGALVCPVCAAPWRQAPFLAALRLHLDVVDNSPNHKRDDSGRKTPSGGPNKV